MSGSTIGNLVTISVTLGGGIHTSPLTITSAGYVNPFAGGYYGATGVVATIAGGSVLNQGTVAGGGGGYNGTYPSPKSSAGGAGVDLANGSLTNVGLITGGNGKYVNYFGVGGAGVVARDSYLFSQGTISGGNGSNDGGGGDAGAGGAGVDATGSSTVISNGLITGGSGGYSETHAAGAGGAGVSLGIGGSLVNSGQIFAGTGGGTYIGYAGAGGDGVDATLATVINSDFISGGRSGAVTHGSIEFPVGAQGVGGTGVDLAGGSLVNGGGIEGGSGGGTGVSLSAGATLTNSGGIEGGNGNIGGTFEPYFYDGGTGLAITGSTVTNYGSILGGAGGRGGDGAYLISGFLTNNGQIAGGRYYSVLYNGNGVSAAGGTLLNSGTVSGGYYGVASGPGVSITNAASAVISGHTGVSVYGGGTLVNAGTISSSVGLGFVPSAAVAFSGTGSSRLIVDPGAVFVGSVAVRGGVATLELASAAGAGMITGIGSSFAGFGVVTIDAGATWTVAGSITAGDTISLGAGGDLTFDGGVTATSPVHFAANTGTLGFAVPAGFGAAVYGFQDGDAFDFTTVTSAGGITAGVNGSNDLTLTSGGSLLAEIKLDPAQNFAGVTFQAVPDGSGGTVVTENAPLCFMAGTMIATASGETPVERLGVGDLVMTAGGQVRPVVWIGIGRVLATRGRRSAATPVIVRKGALGDNVPYCDLVVTKAHALYVDGVLIPVEYLVNHRSILWDDMAREVVLYHVELETHDVLLANGAPAESYRDDGNRWLFRNANSGWDLPPQPSCAPALTGGEQVDAAWLRLLRRAGPRPAVPLTDDPDLHLLVDGHRVEASSRAGAFHVFSLAGRPNAVRIVSRAGAPQELGLGRDPRCLGVAMRRIVIRQGARSCVVAADHPGLRAGFHAFEAANGFRWTDGDAVLPASLFEGFDGRWEVVLHCEGSACYVADGARRNVA